MQRLRHLLSLGFALIIIGGLIALAIYAVVAFFGYVSAVPKELGAALVAGATTILVATITIMGNPPNFH